MPVVRKDRITNTDSTMINIDTVATAAYIAAISSFTEQD